MTIRTQDLQFLYDVKEEKIVVDDDGNPCLYLDPESAAIAAVERFGKNSLRKGLYQVRTSQARGYTNEEAAQEEEVSFRGTSRFSDSAPPQLESGKKKKKS